MTPAAADSYEPQNLERLAQDPIALEKLYRANGDAFLRGLVGCYRRQPDRLVWRIWAARLDVAPPMPGEELREPGAGRPLFDGSFVRMLVIGLLAASAVRLAFHFKWFEEPVILLRLLPTAVLGGMAVMLLAERRVRGALLFVSLGLLALCASVGFLLPEPDFGRSDDARNDFWMLALVHYPLVLWSLMGASLLGRDWSQPGRRLRYIEFNGSLVVMAGVIFAGGIILVLVTLGLFSMVGIKIEEPIIEWVVPYGSLLVPFFAAFFARRNAGALDRVLPPVARVFVALSCVVLAGYVLSLPFWKGSLFERKDDLILINVVLFSGVLLTIFALAQRPEDERARGFDLLCLSLVSLCMATGLLALAGATWWLVEKGASPFRVDGILVNLLALGNLAGLAYFLTGLLRGRRSLAELHRFQGTYFLVYTAYAALILISFPLLGFMAAPTAPQ